MASADYPGQTQDPNGEPEGETEQQEVKDKKASRDYWKRWIEGAKKAAKTHKEDSLAAWREFEHQPGKDEEVRKDDNKTASYPIYWSSVKTIEPAYYARTPKVRAERSFEINDGPALTASKVVERLGKYLVRTSNFDSVMCAAVADFIHADKATTQVIYTADKQIIDQPMMDMMGQPMMDESGAPMVQQVEVATNKKITCAPVCYDEVLHTPEAKTQAEIKEIAYFFSMDEDEAERRFGEEKTRNVTWKLSKSFGEDKDADKNDIPGKYLEGWEIHCKSSKRVYWFSDQYSEDLLDHKDDPNGLREFFPSPPFIIGSKPSKSLYPTPAYIHMRDSLRALHEQAYKVYDLINGIDPRVLVDGSQADLILALNTKGPKYIATQNLAAIVEKGGLENVMMFVPVQELVNAIERLGSLEEKFKNNFYEWFGVPDILRGVSDPIETATAQDIKSTSAHDRFKFQKKQVAQLARDTIEMMVDMALNVMEDAEIAEITGAQYFDQIDQQRFPEAMQLLKNDKARIVRVDIDTDSMSFQDQARLQAQANQAVQTVVTGLQTIAQMSSGDPTFIPTGLKALLVGLEHLEMGREFQDGIKGAVEELMKAKSQPPPAGPPPPDYEAMKLELQGQKQTMDAQAKQRELDQKEAKLAIDGAKVTADAENKQLKQQLEEVVQDFTMQIEAQRLKLEEFSAQIQAANVLQDNERLEQEAANPKSEPKAPQIINVQPPVNVSLGL